MTESPIPSARKDWRWINLSVIHAVHDRQISEHGGSASARDFGSIESAIDRPLNLASYREPDSADLAASYAFGIVKNHPFLDGNKRTACIAARLFRALLSAPETVTDRHLRQLSSAPRPDRSFPS